MNKESCLIIDNEVRANSFSQFGGFWERILSGAPELSSIPSDFSRQAVLGGELGEVFFALDEDLKERVDSLGDSHGVSRHLVLLVAWSVLLARFSGQNDIVVGTSVADVDRVDEGNDGSLKNGTIAVRLDFSGGATTAGLLSLVKDYVRDACRAGQMSLDQLLDASGLARSLSHHPLFQTKLVSKRDVEVTLGARRHATDVGEQPYPPCELVLSIGESGDRDIGFCESSVQSRYHRSCRRKLPPSPERHGG